MYYAVAGIRLSDGGLDVSETYVSDNPEDVAFACPQFTSETSKYSEFVVVLITN